MADPSAEHLKSLAELRWNDAEVLLGAGRHSGAYYLAGYAIECGLKAVIALSFRATVIPSKRFVNDIHTHNLESLIALAGLKQQLDAAGHDNPELEANWAFIAGWKESSRYETIDPFTANRMIMAVGDPKSGVLQWLKTHW